MQNERSEIGAAVCSLFTVLLTMSAAGAVLDCVGDELHRVGNNAWPPASAKPVQGWPAIDTNVEHDCSCGGRGNAPGYVCWVCIQQGEEMGQ